MVPYTPEFVAAALPNLSDEALARITPADFCLWPTKHPLPHAKGRELIARERARRGMKAAGQLL